MSICLRRIGILGIPFIHACIAFPVHADEVSEYLSSWLETHCASCHDSTLPEGGLDVKSLSWDLDDASTFEQWVKLLDRVTRSEMPPSSEPQPTAEARLGFIESLQKPLIEKNLLSNTTHRHTSIRRLNRREYERTVQSLLDISTPLQQFLPEEQPINGFDTVSDGLRFSPLHMERFVEAASEALQAAMRFTALQNH